MKKITFTCVALLAFATISLGQLSFGAGSTYAADGGGFLGVQARTMYNLEDAIDKPMEAVVAFSYYFADRGSLWSVDIDGQYYLTTLGDSIELSTIAGLSIARVSTLFRSNSHVGINFGAEFRIPIGDLNIYVQPKIALDGIGGFVMATGVLF